MVNLAYCRSFGVVVDIDEEINVSSVDGTHGERDGKLCGQKLLMQMQLDSVTKG